MTTPLAIASAPERRSSRSILALACALVANAAMSLAVDQVLHLVDVYPPWGQPMHEPALNLLALSYRLVFGVGAGYLVARLAPRAPMRHAMVLGLVATVLSALGALAAISRQDLGPAWYPIALALLAYPSVRLGAAWQVRAARRRA